MRPGAWNNLDLPSANDPTSVMYPLWEGRTCLPPSMRGSKPNCTIGGFPADVVNATNVAQIQLALNFARNTNIRFVVKNKGHDFAGKSLGAGALSVWTHHLNEIRFFKEYEFGGYKGPAFKLGAGVATKDVYDAAHENGVTVVGGQCRASEPRSARPEESIRADLCGRLLGLPEGTWPRVDTPTLWGSGEWEQIKYAHISDMVCGMLTRPGFIDGSCHP
jgi:hypothetical protein